MKEPLIQGYFENTLNKEGRTRFEQLLKSDKDFNAAFQFELDVRRSLIEEKKNEIRASFRDQERSYQLTTEKNIAKRPMLFYLKYSVAAILLILLSVVAYQYNATTKFEKLYAENFEPYRNIVAPITRNLDSLSAKERAFKSYELKDYKNAEVQLISLAKQTKEDYYFFYLGITQMELGNFSKAIENLNRCSAIENNFKEKSVWYLALAQIKMNEPQKAQHILKKIVSLQSYGYKKAGIILKEL